MAHIVPFRAAAARAVEENEPRANGAQIVIFPGVRRERHAASPADLAHGTTDASRDWLELPEEPPTARP